VSVNEIRPTGDDVRPETRLAVDIEDLDLDVSDRAAAAGGVQLAHIARDTDAPRPPRTPEYLLDEQVWSDDRDPLGGVPVGGLVAAAVNGGLPSHARLRFWGDDKLDVCWVAKLDPDAEFALVFDWPDAQYVSTGVKDVNGKIQLAGDEIQRLQTKTPFDLVGTVIRVVFRGHVSKPPYRYGNNRGCACRTRTQRSCLPISGVDAGKNSRLSATFGLRLGLVLAIASRQQRVPRQRGVRDPDFVEQPFEVERYSGCNGIVGAGFQFAARSNLASTGLFHCQCRGG
jgi:hypothetical protein